MESVTPIRMPKWGLSMQEGTITHWWKAEGGALQAGEDLVDIETSKITNVLECPGDGLLRRVVVSTGETVPVGALLGVIAPASVDDAAVDAFIAEFQANFTPGSEEGEAEGGLALTLLDVPLGPIRVGRAGASGGVPVVLLHGFSGDLNNWTLNLDALASDRAVLALDLPGHGGSTKEVGDGSLDHLARACAGAIDAAALGPAHLVGHSLGAAVAARIALDRPDLARSLTLVAPAHLPGTRVSAEFLTGLTEASRARDLKPVLEMLFADPGLVSRAMIDDMIKFKRLDGVEEALVRLRDRLLDGRDAAALAADLSRLPPTDILASRQDRITGAPDPSALPHQVRVHWIEDSGHMIHMEQAARVNDLIRAALA